MDSKSISDYRVFPRVFSIFYLYLGAEVSYWFMALPDPTAEQSAYAIAFAGTVAAWFKFYVEGGK